jgi:peptide/nickel transport system substrate-binding protein
VAACGSTIDPIPSAAPSTTPPKLTPAPTSGPFIKAAYPASGTAPCGQTAPPDASHGAYTGNIKRISAKDARTIVFELCDPDVAFLARIASPALSINDSGWLKSHTDPTVTGPQAIVSDVNGTGPYTLESWKPGTEVSLARNPAYWGPPAKNERVIIRWTTDAAQRVRELRDGTVDGIDAVDPAGVTTMTDDVALELLPRPGLSVFYLGFNNTLAPFDNEKVRQAIAIGIDRQHIVDTLFPPGSDLASRYTPCAVPHGCAGARWYDFDPTLAKEILAAAGYPNGFDTTIHYRATPTAYLPDPAGVASELQAELLANLGINATLVVEPPDPYLAAVDAGNVDGIHLLGQTAEYPDVSAFLDPRFGPDASAEFGHTFNDIGKALATGDGTADPAKRDAAYAKANVAIRIHVPMVPVADTASTVAYRVDVSGASASALGLDRFASMTPGDRRQLVWLTTAEPGGVSSLICSQVMDTLYAADPTSAAPVPSLAQRCLPNADLAVWTCTLRPGVLFSDGSVLDANDIVLSFAVQWDADHPLHRGHTGAFGTFGSLFGGFLDPPPSPGG